MAIFCSAKEAYLMFLKSDFWINLTRRKCKQAGRCNRCGSRKKLQSHHKFYRNHWFDTIIEDLECLCRNCHRNHHGIKTEPVTESYPSIPVPVVNPVSKPWVPKKKKRRKRRKNEWTGKKRTYTEARQIIEAFKPVRPWYYNNKPSNKWSSRGNSSN